MTNILSIEVHFLRFNHLAPLIRRNGGIFTFDPKSAITVVLIDVDFMKNG